MLHRATHKDTEKLILIISRFVNLLNKCFSQSLILFPGHRQITHQIVTQNPANL